MNELGLLYRFLPTELTPPEEVWDRLVKVLDNNQPNAFERMETLEIEPPAMAWENIVSALDDINIDENANAITFKDKMLDAELAPPAFVWDEIEKSLDENTPVRKIGGNGKVIRMVAIGVAIAACLVGVIFTVFNGSNNQFNSKNTEQVATIKNTTTVPQDNTPIKTTNNDSQQPQNFIQNQPKQKSITNNITPSLSDLTTTDEREFGLEKYTNVPVPTINTTNNKAASFTKKIKDAFGNILDNIKNYNTNSGYIAAIGPNGNAVNVSSRLAEMIPFFQEDSATIKNEEYLDRVMRETNVWRQKLKDWQIKVNSADINPSQMNFLDPIDLLHFLEKNK